ncbi:MAG TPA: hypothetical protein VL574_02535 [Stellaceae bacterium]|nr:hypothetical protein [Stellaceae bacterium]
MAAVADVLKASDFLPGDADWPAPMVESADASPEARRFTAASGLVAIGADWLVALFVRAAACCWAGDGRNGEMKESPWSFTIGPK